MSEVSSKTSNRSTDAGRYLRTTTVTKAPFSLEELMDREGVLVRVETIPTEGWMLFGRPVEEWVQEALDEAEAVGYLSRKVAELEGLEFPSDEWSRRTIALQDEAREWAKSDRSRQAPGQ